MIVRMFSFLLILLGFSESKAQYLAAFSAIQYQTSIELNITLAGGNTCNGINILRSSDGIHFSPIGGIAGVCGSSTEDVFYSFTDTDPVRNASNYYRLDLITLGYTSIIQIHFVYFGGNAILIYPNPVNYKASVYISDVYGNLFSYSITDLAGKLLKQVEGLRGNYFDLDREDWPSGLYYLEVQTGAHKVLVRSFLIE